MGVQADSLYRQTACSLDRLMDGGMGVQADSLLAGQIDGWRNGCTDRQLACWWMNEWMGGQMDGQRTS